MPEKKRDITKIAGQLFMRRGFNNTSVQDIAIACNVSKATIYKFFGSKEELAFAVVCQVYEELLDVVAAVGKEPLSPFEQLHRIVVIYLDDLHNQLKFIDTLIFVLSPEQKAHYMPLLAQEQFKFFGAFNKVLGRAFDLASEAAAWELTLNFSGILREIFFLQPNADLAIETVNWADYVVDSLKAIADTRRSRPPLISDEFLAKLKRYYQQGPVPDNEESRRLQLLDALRERVQQHSPREMQYNLCGAIDALEMQYQAPDENKPFLVEMLYTYLAQRRELVDTVGELRRLDKKSKPAL